MEQVMSNGHDGEGAVGGGSAFYSYAILSAGIEQLQKMGNSANKMPWPTRGCWGRNAPLLRRTSRCRDGNPED